MLRIRLNDALKQLQLSRDTVAVATVRLVLAALHDRDITERRRGNMDGLPDEQIVALLQAMIKQRRESIQLYEQGNRPDLARQEAEEIDVIRQFLPPLLSEEETVAAVHEAVDETGACALKDMGRVMGVLKQRYGGRMDFAKAGAMVRNKLA